MENNNGKYNSARRSSQISQIVSTTITSAKEFRSKHVLGELKLEGDMGTAEYDQCYLSKRILRRTGRVWGLWGLGVTTVISGDYYGWNVSLGKGGFGGICLATLFAASLYMNLAFMCSELGATLPFSGGSFAYTRVTMGRSAAFLAGLTENMEYKVFGGLMLVSLGDFSAELFGTDPDYNPLYWLLYLAVGISIHMLPPRAMWGTLCAFSVLSCLLLVFAGIAALPHIDFSKYTTDIDPDKFHKGDTDVWFPSVFPNGIFMGTLRAMPGAVWWYTGFECIVLATEEIHLVRTHEEDSIAVATSRTTYRALLWTWVTLSCTAVLVILTAIPVPPGAMALSESAYPLVDTLSIIYGEQYKSLFLSLLFVPYFGNLIGLMYAFSRQTHALSRAAYFPSAMSVTYRDYCPLNALISGSIYAYSSALVVYLFKASSSVSKVLLFLAILAALLSYCMTSMCYLLLRLQLPEIERPFVSPTGVAGAVYVMLACLLTMVSMLVLEPAVRMSFCTFVIKTWAAFVMFKRNARPLQSSPEEVYIRVERERMRTPEHAKTRQGYVHRCNDPKSPWITRKMLALWPSPIFNDEAHAVASSVNGNRGVTVQTIVVTGGEKYEVVAPSSPARGGIVRENTGAMSGGGGSNSIVWPANEEGGSGSRSIRLTEGSGSRNIRVKRRSATQSLKDMAQVAVDYVIPA